MIRWRLVILSAALAASAGLGIVSIRNAEQNAAILDACGAVESGDWNTVLARTENLSVFGSAALDAAECRCIALVATDRNAECESLMDRLLADPTSDGWSPNPDLAVHLIQSRRSEGRIREAADLARRAAIQFPSNGDLFFLELSTRSSVEDETRVLRELEARIDPEAPEATRMKTSLATRHLIRGDARRALDVLGPGPPKGSREAVERWYDTRGMALANTGDLAAVKQSYADWARAGGDPMELQARYALTLSITGLADPDASILALLVDALAKTDGLVDERLTEALATRLILTLVEADRQEQALATYNERGLFESSAYSIRMMLNLVDVYVERVDSAEARLVAALLLTDLSYHTPQSAPSMALLLRALDLAPNHEAPLLGLAKLFEIRGEYEEARTYLQRLIEAHGENGEAKLRLAVNLDRFGKRREARELFQQLLKSAAPSWVRSLSYQELARILMEEGELEPAVLLLEQGAQEFPSDFNLLVYLAYLTDRTGRSRGWSLAASMEECAKDCDVSPRMTYLQRAGTAQAQLHEQLQAYSASSFETLSQTLLPAPQ